MPRRFSALRSPSPHVQCPDAPRPSDVSSLERLFNSVEQSGEVIRFARSLTARELMAAEEFYTPFIPGCGG